MRIHGIAGLIVRSNRQENWKAAPDLWPLSIASRSFSPPPGASRVRIYLRPGELGLVRGLPFSLLSMLVGWWGIPWGVVYTPLVLITNFSGGRDITKEVLAALRSDSSASPLGETEA